MHMQKKWIAGGLLVLGLLGMCGCSSQAFVSEQQTETVLTKEETGWKFQDGMLGRYCLSPRLDR